jgi:hypothetical protein
VIDLKTDQRGATVMDEEEVVEVVEVVEAEEAEELEEGEGSKTTITQTTIIITTAINNSTLMMKY